MAETTTCRKCGKRIRFESPHTGWVETLSGDEGGNYDLCMSNQPDLVHVPKRATHEFAAYDD
ncbi:hypothetical protein [Terracoccus sp. 273MFTsu3.1]|uniref:hypothetical protein n=1 Tax=Terracoccus sp. 273MFTsu3.1 TaxID=1172188 RepID=UPI0005B89D8C|nr:hypothetical protein [Terracoccus sp. 273MFTsu3.1]